MANVMIIRNENDISCLGVNITNLPQIIKSEKKISYIFNVNNSLVVYANGDNLMFCWVDNGDNSYVVFENMRHNINSRIENDKFILDVLPQ